MLRLLSPQTMSALTMKVATSSKIAEMSTILPATSALFSRVTLATSSPSLTLVSLGILQRSMSLSRTTTSRPSGQAKLIPS